MNEVKNLANAEAGHGNSNTTGFAPASKKKPLYRNLAVQMVFALIAGALLGMWLPDLATQMSPLSAAFLKMIKALVGLVIFCTIVAGIANIGSGAGVGRIGLKSLIYFEVITTIAMALGLILANVFQPGSGMNIDLSSLDASALATFTETAERRTTVSWLMSIIPDTFVSAFTNGNILPVLLLALMFGGALLSMGKRAEPVIMIVERISEAIFIMVGMVMKFAPLAVFAAIAFTIGKYGIGSMLPLAKLLVLFYLACIGFIVIVLGAIAAYARVPLWGLIKYLKVELLLAFGTASSEAVLPSVMKKLEKAGCKKHIVGFVIPSGFSFNLDGSSMYFVMAVIFVAQACNIDLTFYEEIMLILIFMVTSKGIAGVAGSGFVTLAATLTVYPHVPLAGIVLLLGVDRFMDAMRTVTNLTGNAVATFVIAASEDALDKAQMHSAFLQEK